MNLADEIIQGHLEQVAALLQMGGDVNELDEYGYTPLIEAGITNNTEMGELLLNHGADPNGEDLTGGTALQWAAENHNLDFCKLLLEKGADPNAYTAYSQPILLKPLLRQQQDLKELLYHYGADLNFVQDYINTKLIGHRFELVGNVYIVDPEGKFIELNFEGFILEFTVEVILDSLMRYRNNFAARAVREYFNQLYRIVEAFSVTAELLKYQQYLHDIDQYRDKIDFLLNRELLFLPIGYHGHAISLVIYKDMLAMCDRGERSRRGHASIEIYRINNMGALNLDFLKNLFYEAHDRRFINKQLFRILGLKKIDEITLPSQRAGNCSWANMEVAIPAIFYMLTVDQDDKEAALDLYQHWRDWDKDRALHECIESFYYSARPRRISKAEVLASVLFQACSIKDKKELARAEKIIKMLDVPSYRFVLEGYLKVFTKQSRSKLGKNLSKILDLLDSGLVG